jgi:DNA recombination protein RmuC
MNPETIIAILGISAAIACGALAWVFRKQASILSAEKSRLEIELAESRASLKAEKTAASMVEEKLNQLPASLVDKLKNESSTINERLLEKSSQKVISDNEAAVKSHINNFQASINQILDELRNQHTTGGMRVQSLEAMVRVLNESNQSLTAKAGDLARALTSSGSSKTQGSWGEAQLRRLLEDSGMMKHVSFSPQETIKDSENNRLVPDFVINLPEGKKMIVDAKVSLPSAFKVKTFKNEDELREAREELHKSLIAHIDGLAAKNYAKAFGDWSPEFVFMYVPLPGVIDEAIEHKRDLYEYAIRKNVVLAEPRTVMALLLCASQIWKLSEQNQNQGKIIKLGEDLLGALGSVRESWMKMGEGLSKAKEAYEAAGQKVLGSDGRSLEGYAKKLQDLSVTPKISKSAGRRKRKTQVIEGGQGQFLDVSAEQVADEAEGEDLGEAEEEQVSQ